MTKPIAIKGLAGVEHAQADGSYVAYAPVDEFLTEIRAGDRVRVRLDGADGAWIYAIGVYRQSRYWKLGAWGPGTRMLWPGGRVLSAADAAMTSLLVIASRDKLAWADELVHADCSALEDTRPVDPPVTACDRLYGLFWKLPPRVRTPTVPEVELFHDGNAEIPGVVAAHSGEPYTVLEWQYRPAR